MNSAPPRAELLARIVDAAPVACLIGEAGAQDWQVSPGLNRLLGLPEGWTTWSQANLEQHLHQEDISHWHAYLVELASGQGSGAMSLRLRHAGGDWRRCACSGLLHAGARILMFNDKTELLQVESALLDSQMRWRGLHDATPVALLLWNREGRITDWNRMATATFGHAREDVIGRKLVPLLIHPDDYTRFSGAIQAALSDNSTQRITCRSLRIDAQELLCEWHSLPMRSAKGSLIGVLSLALDITAQARAEASLRESRDMAERLSQAKSEFMATISHELRTPLTGVLGMAQLLGELVAGQEERGLVKDIEDNGQQLLQIINAIIDYTDIDASPPEECQEEMDIAESLGMLVERYQIAAMKRGLTTAVEIDDALFEPQRIDRPALERIVGNLLDNAVRFTESGGIRLRASRLLNTQGEPLLELEIADSGIGMSPEFIRDHLYMPFKQAENAFVRKHGGVGLGLALARKLVDRLRGEIELSSHPGQGSCFTVRIPLTLPAGRARTGL